MNAKQRKKLFWESVASDLRSGRIPSVYMNSVSELCLEDSDRTVPARLAPLFPKEVIEDARRRSVEHAKARKAEYEQRVQQLAKEEAALNERTDEKGFTLLAGENTEIVESGTFGKCRASLWKVTQQPRGDFSGIGCWIICDGNGDVVEQGKFNSDGLTWKTSN